MSFNSGTLAGVWKVDPCDRPSIEAYGLTEMKFTSRGELIYTVHESDKDGIILMRYRVEGQEIVTDQPSQPREERTRFEFTPDGALLLFLGGQESRWLRP